MKTIRLFSLKILFLKVFVKFFSGIHAIIPANSWMSISQLYYCSNWTLIYTGIELSQYRHFKLNKIIMIIRKFKMFISIFSKISFIIVMASVTLYIYDLTMGMARMLSPGLIGRQIEGIWHTAVVVYGTEFFFGGGICEAPPGSTMAGRPVQTLNMGVTNKSLDDFKQFLKCISHRFTMTTYHLIKHNCNNFTDECCRYLVNKRIPSHITGLPEDLLSTPLGRQFAPMIESMSSVGTQLGFSLNPTTDYFADYIRHSDFLSDFKDIDSYPSFDEFIQKEGVIVYWDPRDEGFIDKLEILRRVSEKIQLGCVDLLRCFYLAPGSTSAAQIYLQGECINTYPLDELEAALAELDDVRECIKESLSS
ncbi:unnamed protein product [Blepharisma stoltei]|uniref:PPPDE domain-containing protein n=1 Tax=Blepharisma stoltei TaxID=1481888 RepID=A0AAU9J348_9CILI|nr:unnamed protein product [Blepharisma stoltei]